MRITHVVSAKTKSASVSKALERNALAVSPDWLTDSAARWCRQKEDGYNLLVSKRPPPPPPPSPLGEAEAIELALTLIPPSLSHTERLKAVIKFLVPHTDKPKADAYFRAFDQALATANPEQKAESLQAITRLVGEQTLKAVLTALGVTRAQ